MTMSIPMSVASCAMADKMFLCAIEIIYFSCRHDEQNMEFEILKLRLTVRGATLVGGAYTSLIAILKSRWSLPA